MKSRSFGIDDTVSASLVLDLGFVKKSTVVVFVQTQVNLGFPLHLFLCLLWGFPWVPLLAVSSNGLSTHRRDSGQYAFSK